MSPTLLYCLLSVEAGMLAALLLMALLTMAGGGRKRRGKRQIKVF